MYDQAKENDGVREITATYLTWDRVGQTIVGRYINQSTVESSQGGSHYNQYLFESDMGMVKFSLGRIADSEVGPVMVKGQVYAITFEGQKQIGRGRRVNRFKVEMIDNVREYDNELEVIED